MILFHHPCAEIGMPMDFNQPIGLVFVENPWSVPERNNLQDGAQLEGGSKRSLKN